MNRNFIYTAATILAGILWGIISLIVKPLSSAGLSSMQILVLRGLFSSVFLFIFLVIKDKSLLKIQLKDLWMFIGTGVISLTFFSLCYFKTILECGASVAVILLYTSPIFVLLFSMILFKEKITLLKFIALCMTFAGCILVTEIFGGTNHITFSGFMIGLCAGLGYSLYSVFSRFALKKYKPLTITFYTFLFSGLSALPFAKINLLPSLLSPKVILFSLLIALICTVLPYIFYTFGLSGLETGKAAILVTVEPLVGCLVGILIFKEGFSIQKICGIILILAAIILLGLNTNKSVEEKNSEDTNENTDC